VPLNQVIEFIKQFLYMNYNIHCIKRKRIDLMIEGDSEKKKNTPRCGHTLLPGL